MSDTSVTTNQDEKLKYKSQELSDLLLESPLDDDCKGDTITNAIKKLKLTSKLKDKLRKISDLQKKSRTK